VRAGRALALLLAAGAAVALAACGERVPSTPPRPTVVVITAEGPYFTGFDTAGEWLVGGGGSSHGVVQDGVYVLGVEQPDWMAWTRQPRAFGDGVYEVDARLASGAEGSAFGLLLLGSSDLRSFFYCMITGDGRYDVGYCEDACRTQESLTGGFTLGYPILTNGEFNRLRVELQSDELTFIVNGSPLTQVGGLEYGEGLVGLIGESGPYGGFEAEFDNLQVVEGAFQASQ
jgi:hypothetical protein